MHVLRASGRQAYFRFGKSPTIVAGRAFLAPSTAVKGGEPSSSAFTPGLSGLPPSLYWERTLTDLGGALQRARPEMHPRD